MSRFTSETLPDIPEQALTSPLIPRESGCRPASGPSSRKAPSDTMPLKFAPSPDTSGCVCSRAASDSRCVASFTVSVDPADEFLQVKNWVASLRRTVVLTATDKYVHATYRSRLLSDCRTQLGLDHIELRLCTEHGMIHIRSTRKITCYATWAVSEDPADEFLRFKDALTSSWRTTILTETDEYLHAVWMVSPWVLDDIESRLFTGHGMIHVRSTSQYGFWDFQFNRRRIEKLCRRLQSG